MSASEQGQPHTDAGRQTPDEFMSITMPITGMTCAACVIHVGNALREVTGVLKAEVNLATERATVRVDPSCVRTDTLRKAVQDAGY